MVHLSSSRDSGSAGIPYRSPRGPAKLERQPAGPKGSAHIPHPPGIPAPPASLPACGEAMQIAKRKSALKQAWCGFSLTICGG